MPLPPAARPPLHPWSAPLGLLGLLALGQLSCGDPAPDPPSAVAASPLDLRPGRAQQVVRLLDLVTAEGLTLSGDNLPADASEDLAVVLDSSWRPGPWGQGRVWQHRSPVRFEQKRFSAAPLGMSLSTGDRSLPFDARIVEDAGLSQRWVMADDTLYLTSRQDPARWPTPPTLRYAGVAQREARWNLDPSGLDPLDFAVRQVAAGPLTHPCLYLPAPSRAAIRVDLPAGQPTLAWSVAIADAVSSSRPAIASARLSVVVDGTATVLDRTTSKAGLDWVDVQADLSPWAGQTVELVFESETDGDPARDYLCIGKPRVLAPAPPQPDPVRLVVIGIDTLRVDHLGVYGHERDTSPKLDRIASQSVRFDRTWAPAPRTRPSFRTSTTGRWPLAALTAPTFGEVLATHGFTTGGIVANVHLTDRLGFADGFDDWHYDNGANADIQVDRALSWLTVHQDQDSFLFLHVMDPHTFYLAPEPYRDRFNEGLSAGDLPDKYNRWMVAGWDADERLTDDQKRFITGRYDGEIAWTDAQLGRLLDGIDALPGRSLVVLHTDHGEELWDHGGFEHNHTLYDELNRALLWFRPPGGRSSALPLDHPASIADIPPTLYDAVGVPPEAWPELDGRSLWDLIDPARSGTDLAAALDQRPLHLGYLMFDTERWAVVAPDAQGVLHKYVLVTASGQQMLFDLEADPGEKRDLAVASEFDPTPWAAALAEATGWPVGPGWRLQLTPGMGPFTIQVDGNLMDAGVIDPEAALARRANLEWGEVPAVLPADVALVSRQDDGRSIKVVPGGAAGTAYLTGEISALTITDEVGTRSLSAGSSAVAKGQLTATPGIVIVPSLTEAAALAAAARHDDNGATPAQLEALRALGYLED